MESFAEGPTLKKQKGAKKALKQASPVAPSCLSLALSPPPAAVQAAPWVGSAVAFLLALAPFAAFFFSLLRDFYTAAFTLLPPDVLPVAGGLLLCFLGGDFYALIAAHEAFRACGGQAALASLDVLHTQLRTSLAAVAADEAKEGGKGGKAVSAEAQLKRKALSAARALQPEALTSALGCLWTTWLGMLATLRLTLARVLVLANGLALKLLPLAQRHALPPLTAALPAELKKWDATLLEGGVKLAVLLACSLLSSLLAAAYSALRGAQEVVAHGLPLLRAHGLLKAPLDDKAAQALGFGIAALGVLTQLYSGFHVPFPLSLLLFPAIFAEKVLRLVAI